MSEQAPHRMVVAGQALYALQEVVWPQSHHPVRALVLRITGDVVQMPLGRGLRFQGGQLRLDTAHNIFALGKWRRGAGLTDLKLVVEGEGQFDLTVHSESPKGARSRSQGLTLTQGQPLVLEMGDWIASEAEILHLALTTEGAGSLTGLTWASPTPPLRLPHLALAITTFRREAEARRAIERFAGRGARLAGFLDLLVVDNGQTLEPVSLPHIRVIPNRNLGGSGGFARGMAEAREIGATHCLFMDDDASLDNSGLFRIWTFLAHATDPRTAIAGALMSAEFPSHLWENGATFDGGFRALSRGVDLGDPPALFAAEIDSLIQRRNFYGGFWCYAFPMDHVTHAPFPFFVRGDDTSFCIANGFANVTLPGVFCHQDVDFTEKENSQTLYLDLRSNLIHLATLPQDRRLVRSIALIARFFGRCLMQHQVDSLGGLNAAVEDFLAGPAALEPDLATRRAALAAARKTEVWRDVTGPLPKPRRRFNPHRPWVRALFAFGLNGLLLPGFGIWGDRVVLPQKQRGIVRPCFGASVVHYISTDRKKIMTVPLNRWGALREAVRMVGNIARLVLHARRLRRDWAKGYETMTRPEWWAQFR